MVASINILSLYLILSYNSGVAEIAVMLLEGCLACKTTIVFVAHHGSMLSPVRNTVILQCFDADGSATGRASGL